MPRGKARGQADGGQFSLPLDERRPRPTLRVVRGDGPTAPERLASRDAVARLLLAVAADLLAHRITPAAANAIQRQVDRVLRRFDAAGATPETDRLLRRELDALEATARTGARPRGGRG